MKKIIIHLSFIAYVTIYNFIGTLKDNICYLLDIKPPMLPSFLWLDFKCWHSLPEHPCHKLSKYVRNIYFTTGLLPKKEYMYLLDK